MIIPSDIVIFEILTRLPVKSLLRFRCVSKQWRSAMADPTFVNLHRSRSLTRPGGTAILLPFPSHKYKQPNIIFTIQHPQHPLSHSVLRNPLHHVNLPEFRFNFTTESINGIICLYGFDQNRREIICVCNPSTKESITILDPATQEPGFDSCSSFGFDPSTKTYKVVRSWYHCHASPCNHSIFTLGSNTWRSLKGGPPHFLHTQGVCINGTIYWKNKPYKHGPFGIVAFDVGDETYRMIQLPFPPEADMMTGHMGSVLTRVGEDLALVDYEHLVKGNIMLMWVLKINHRDKVWVEKRIEFPSQWKGVPEVNTRFLMEPLFVFTVHTGEIVLIPSVLSKNFGVFYYDTEKKSLRKVEVSGLPDYGMTHYSRVLFALCATEVVENVLSLRDMSS